mmetsp:Transcript_137946/g.440543  ORF Transcript_137946/g.440543 Transcript_137946/m.440543 type:complete len:267 (-) Transcript_137946:3-803(-)
MPTPLGTFASTAEPKPSKPSLPFVLHGDGCDDDATASPVAGKASKPPSHLPPQADCSATGPPELASAAAAPEFAPKASSKPAPQLVPQAHGCDAESPAPIIAADDSEKANALLERVPGPVAPHADACDTEAPAATASAEESRVSKPCATQADGCDTVAVELFTTVPAASSGAVPNASPKPPKPPPQTEELAGLLLKGSAPKPTPAAEVTMPEGGEASESSPEDPGPNFPKAMLHQSSMSTCALCKITTVTPSKGHQRVPLRGKSTT